MITQEELEKLPKEKLLEIVLDAAGMDPQLNARLELAHMESRIQEMLAKKGGKRRGKNTTDWRRNNCERALSEIAKLGRGRARVRSAAVH